MLIDACTLPSGKTVETEICIVGSGPVGMTLARELIGQDFRVCLLEGGGLDLDQNAQSQLKGEVVGDYYTPLDEIRRLQCGGTANAWDIELNPNQMGVRYVPLDPIDFEKRDWLPHSGWPFGRSHLDPYYARAQDACQIGPFAYEAEAWEDAQTQRLSFGSNQVETSMFQFGPSAVFTQDYRQQVAQSRNITLYLHANAVELETDDAAKTVTAVRVVCPSGNEFRVSAKVVILAAGSIENIRLLLLSDRTQNTGLGNQYDQVGRFFMDHPLVHTGMFIPSRRTLFNSTALYDWRRINQTLVMGKLTLSDEAKQVEQVLNMCAILFPQYPVNQSEAVRAVKRLFGLSKRNDSNQSTFSDLYKAVTGVGEIAGTVYDLIKPKPPLLTSRLSQGGWSQLPNKEKLFGYFDVLSPSEQAPDPDNRLVLSDQRDRLGSRKVTLHWCWREFDIQSVKRTQQILANEIARAGLGQLQLTRGDGDKPLLASPSMHHPLGGTRMHRDPKQGVVDENCKVHGVSNLYISGGSVFPTGGFANPTLTVVALAIRLADRVKQTLIGDRAMSVQQSVNSSNPS